VFRVVLSGGLAVLSLRIRQRAEKPRPVEHVPYLTVAAYDRLKIPANITLYRPDI
jgi:hypothetical protein